MMNNRILVWFSCGAAYAVASKMTLRLFPEREVKIVCCDTRPALATSEPEEDVPF